VKAEELLKRIRNGEDFADIAKSDSDGATAKTGGDLGFFAHGKLSPSLDQLVFSRKVGDVSDVVQTKQRFVILKVLDKKIRQECGHYR
jgi:parvulin-like peptidyl-prolyl isomerase